MGKLSPLSTVVALPILDRRSLSAQVDVLHGVLLLRRRACDGPGWLE